MTVSSVDPQAVLSKWCTTLQERAKEQGEEPVDPEDQLAVENAVAAGVAVLAGEPAPAPSHKLPTRAILTKDLLITADLVRRALVQYQD